MAANIIEYQTEIKAFKETLQAQQELLQNLYFELDAERESSATAASESLSMILRLQEQKALVEMEASHYKRIAEEKMFHTEESLVAVEDLMYQKDMEITSLEFQVEAYKCKLLSMGCHADVSRNNSLPPIPATTKGSFVKRGVEKDLDRDNKERSNGGQYLESEKSFDNSVVGNLDSYWEQIRKLDERVKERLDCNKDQERRSIHRSLHRRSRSSSISAKVKYDALVENEAIVITEIQDIFEVPQLDQEHKSCGKGKVEQDELFSEGEKRLVKPEGGVLQDTLNQDKHNSFVRHTLKCTQPEIFKPCVGHSVKRHMDDGVYKAEIQQLTSRMERLETRIGLRDEISEQRDNELLWKEMREQLNLLQSEMRSGRPSPSQPDDDASLIIPIMEEAMLSFWL